MESWKAYFFSERNNPYFRQNVPFYYSSLGLNFDALEKNKLWIKFKGSADIAITNMVYWSPKELIWKPGMFGFEKLHRLIMKSDIALILFILACFGILVVGKYKIQFLAFMYFSCLVLFYLASFILSGMRNKEVVTILPTLFLFMSIGLDSVLRMVFKVINIVIIKVRFVLK